MASDVEAESISLIPKSKRNLQLLPKCISKTKNIIKTQNARRH
jgi:hypothetical protein